MIVRKGNFKDDHHLSFFPQNKSSFFCACGKACFATAQLPLFLLQEMTAVILAVIACHRRMHDNKNDDSHFVGSEKPLSVKKKQTFSSSHLSSLRNDDDR